MGARGHSTGCIGPDPVFRLEVDDLPAARHIAVPTCPHGPADWRRKIEFGWLAVLIERVNVIGLLPFPTDDLGNFVALVLAGVIRIDNHKGKFTVLGFGLNLNRDGDVLQFSELTVGRSFCDRPDVRERNSGVIEVADHHRFAVFGFGRVSENL